MADSDCVSFCSPGKSAVSISVSVVPAGSLSKASSSTFPGSISVLVLLCSFLPIFVSLE